MVSDLISRQAAIDAVADGLKNVFVENRDVAEKLLKNLPSIDPVKHGKWIVVKRHEHYPSGKPYEQAQCPFCRRFDSNGDGCFCGYCGADMREK